MVGFRNICCIWLTIYIIFIVLAVLIIVGIIFVAMHYANQEERRMRYVRSTSREDSNAIMLMVVAFFTEVSPIKSMFKGAAPLIIDIYFFICINSLYHETEDFNGTQVPGDNIFVIEQQQLVRIDNLRGQQPPPYNPTMQPGCSTQVVIPMQSMYPDEPKIKPEAV